MARIIKPAWNKWGRRAIAPFIALAMLAAFVTPAMAWDSSANGVNDTGLFQLEGNTTPNVCTTVNDWGGLWSTDTTPLKNDSPCGSDGWKFVTDGTGNADNTYWSGGGSKDAYDPGLGPWQWSTTDVAPDKDDIVNAFAAAYHVTDTNPDTTVNPSGTARFLFFGADRFAINGDAQMGFQFLQGNACLAPIGSTAANDGGCPSTTPVVAANAGKFVNKDTGALVHHLNGDILVLVNFNNGGTLGLAGVFKWSGAGAAPNASGAGSYSQVLFGNGADCAVITGANKFCSTANKQALSEPVWGYTNKSGGSTYQTSAFIEGGLDLSAIPGAGTCFPGFIAETRSSAGPSSGIGLTAQLKDLAFGSFQTCGSTTATTPSSSSDGNTPIPSTGVSVGTGNSGVDVYDKAVVTVTGTDTFGGNVSFHLCGPTALTSTALCDSGGAAIGTAKAVTPPSPRTVVSDAAHLTSAGRYCFRADYSGDTSAGLSGSHDSRASECFIVKPVLPTLSTQAVDADGANITAAVPFGSTIYDIGTLGATAYKPGTGGAGGGDPSIDPTARTTKAQGSITFKLYGPDAAGTTTNCNVLATGFSTAGITVNVDGDGTYGGPTSTPIVGFEPQAPGVYHWKATYTGDSPNTLGVSDNSDCTEGSEDVTVQQLQPTIDTAQSFVPNDSATINVDGGTGALSGYVIFKLYSGTAAADCSGTPDYTSVHVAVSAPDTGAGMTLSDTVDSANTTSYKTDGTVFSWVVEFHSTNAAHLDATSPCQNETSGITINNGSQQPSS